MPSATTGITPFFANKGYHPNITIHPKHNLVSARAHDFVTDLDELHQELKTHIADTQHCYQVSADFQQTRVPKFPFRSQAFIKAQFFCMTWPSKKLSGKFLGPYKILAHPSTH